MRRRAAIAALLALAPACCCAAVASAAHGARAAFVRVDQVGYATSGPKRAYLMSGRDQAGASFSVMRAADGAVVFSGHASASLGSWSGRFRHVYALDFDSLQTAGVYVIRLAAGPEAVSPRFAIAAPSSLYAGPLENALSFYRNQRDGPEFIPSTLRTAPGHLNDAAATPYLTPPVDEEGEFKRDLVSLPGKVDASGGWWDAGDYLKFVQTTSYTVDLQLAGVRDFPDAMGAAAGAADFTAEARFGVEWLLRMWNGSTRTLYYQVGIGSGNKTTAGDHDLWRLPQADDTYGGEDPRFRYIRHRPVLRAGPPGSLVSPNLAGRDAAAFGLCAQVFAHTAPALAERCLRAGEDIFALADTNPRGRLLTVVPFGFYPETQWRDDLELGATELALAAPSDREPPFYLQRAAHWANEYIAHARSAADPLNLYDVSGLAHFELVRALRRSRDAAGLEISEEQLLSSLRRQLNASLDLAREDPFGFGFPWNAADTASHASGLSVMASEYDYLLGEGTFAPYAERWLANVLGANAWGSSFIVGDGSTFPRCPQHQVANLAGSLDGSAPVLAGAVVEGPSDETSRGLVRGMRGCASKGANSFKRFDGKAVYDDNVQSYTTVEPAIDLSASSMLAFSWQVSAPSPLGG